MKEYRCEDKECHRLLFKTNIKQNKEVALEVKCPKCKKINNVVLKYFLCPAKSKKIIFLSSIFMFHLII